MKKIENLGVIKKKHNSGMAETNKGNKFPSIKCELGDVMLEVEGKRLIVSPEQYEKEYKADVAKFAKETKANEKKAEETKVATDAKKADEVKEKDLEIAKKNAELEAAEAEIAQLKADKEKAEAVEAARVLEEMEKTKKEEKDA